MADDDIGGAEGKKLARSSRLEAVIKRLRPIVFMDAIAPAKIIKTEAKWTFDPGQSEMKEKFDAVTARLDNAKATAKCNGDGTITITITI